MVDAVKGLSFSVEPGELVGFIGENGAGKSTTIKMMSGILYPSSGEISVCGLTPYKNRKKNAANIGVVFGQKSRLMWDLPMMDSFNLFKEIYSIDSNRFKKNVDLFLDMLELGEVQYTPVRQLSLGQRMKAEVLLALLHDPKVIFLDEPTIGLDVLAKRNIRNFLRDKNRTGDTTVILTSHDMKDLDIVCDRIVMITKGSLFFDGAIDSFKRKFSEKSIAELTFQTDQIITTVLKDCAIEYELNGNVLTVWYDENQIHLPQILSLIHQDNVLENINIKEPDIEDIVRGIYLEHR